MNRYFIYVGTAFQGVISADNEVQAINGWSLRTRMSWLILRAEPAPTIHKLKQPKAVA